jgi:hypothetical protein
LMTRRRLAPQHQSRAKVVKIELVVLDGREVVVLRP